MKQTIKFFAIVAMSAVIAFGAGMIVLAMCGSERAFFCTFFFGAIAIALTMGAFDSKKSESKHESVKYDGRRNYGQAAVFVGTACLFLGTPQDCEELADDLWHRGVQAEVSEITGNETDFIVL